LKVGVTPTEDCVTWDKSEGFEVVIKSVIFNAK